MSSMLEQAIVDAKSLKDAALRNAEHLIIEKYSNEIRRLYLQYAHEKYGNSGVVVDKSMTNNRYLWLIKKIFPNSPIIFIKRNILDTVWSCYRTHFN